MRVRNSGGGRRWMAAGAGIAVTAAVVLAAAGDLDDTFGSGGVVRTDADSQGEAWDAVVLTDGKIVAGGVQSGSWKLRRYASDGTLDTAFGSGGAVTLFGTNGSDNLVDLALDGSGRIVAAGYASVLVTSGSGKKATTSVVRLATVVRLAADGTLDTTFGAGGVVTIPAAGTASTDANSVAIQGDGRIVVAGRATVTGKKSTQSALLVARLTSGGAMDGTFGTGGVTVHDVTTGNDTAAAHSLAVQSDGRIVLGGTNGQNQGIVTRYLASGAVDTGFGVVTSSDTFVRVGVDASDRIVAIGQRFVTGGSDMLVTRYTAGGALDTAFGSGGSVTIDTNTNEQALAGPFVQSDGTIAFAATCWGSSGSQKVVVAVRLDATGARDATFGTNGVALPLTLGTSGGRAVGGTLAPDGNLVISGNVVDSTGSGNTFDWLLARYLMD